MPNHLHTVYISLLPLLHFSMDLTLLRLLNFPILTKITNDLHTIKSNDQFSVHISFKLSIASDITGYFLPSVYSSSLIATPIHAFLLPISTEELNEPTKPVTQASSWNSIVSSHLKTTPWILTLASGTTQHILFSWSLLPNLTHHYCILSPSILLLKSFAAV